MKMMNQNIKQGQDKNRDQELTLVNMQMACPISEYTDLNSAITSPATGSVTPNPDPRSSRSSRNVSRNPTMSFSAASIEG